VNISAEEKLMYEVMKAIYESDIPVCFKGSMFLLILIQFFISFEMAKSP
jgi:hypothetical protein